MNKINIRFFLGTSLKLRNEMVKNLNVTYGKYVRELSKQDLAYKKMVNSLPHRFLSGYTYGEDPPRPLRSQRIAEIPVETDVNSFVISYDVCKI